MTTYNTTLIVTVNASIGDVSRVFDDLQRARTWLNEMQIRLQWMEDIGLLALVNGSDKRWGRDGFEYLGREREPGRV